ncbi:uncharacterized protein LOC133817174 [Humulus lupulus]|uniref:uncharacterized protein LOC133817174 n=1 Tax=Humulus lupulus TaxID=3486 RepID=UPI002B40A792|nr:uncharacterized protein LOC133817174 [Humulus lupulus]
MGGVTSCVANKLAFLPPKPAGYTVFRDSKTNRLSLSVLPYQQNADVLLLSTRCGTKIVAVYIRYPMATTTVLFSHGNASDLGTTYPYLVSLSSQLRVNIMGYDYSGYGQSTGTPSEENSYADIEAALGYVEKSCGIRREDIILYGHSLGSGPTVELAFRFSRFKAVILQSPILSGFRVVYPTNESYWFDIYKNVDKIPMVDCPILVIHGTDDKVVRFSHGKTLWSLCKNKFEPLWIEGGDHNDLHEFPQFIPHLLSFLSALDQKPLAPAPVSYDIKIR